MLALMLTPFCSFIALGSGSSVIVRVGEFEPFPYHVLNSWHQSSELNPMAAKLC